MSIRVHVSQLGTACLPVKYALALDNCAIRLFTPHKDALNQAGRFLRNGGAVVLGGDWSEVTGLADRLAAKASDLLPKLKDARERKQAARCFRHRIMTTLAVAVQDFYPREVVSGLVGEKELPDLPVLVPVSEAVALRELRYSLLHVPAIDTELFTHPDVLTPRSRETIDLMVAALSLAAPKMPAGPRILDMGCGSGVLTIAAADTLKHLGPEITATDILQEALAMTKLNVARLQARGRLAGTITCFSQGGDLFEPLAGQTFDLIIFNAPWVVAPAHNRAELALNDGGQQTIERFLQGCRQHLNPGGQVIVGYADNSGPKAIERLEKMIEGAGLRTATVLKDRIKTYRTKRPWQTIYAYFLAGSDVAAGQVAD